LVTGPASSERSWTVLAVRVRAEPSRHRVAVWRELRRVGALSLGQGVWALPSAPGVFNGCPVTPGADQYCETLAANPGPDSGPAEAPQLYLSLANTATCDVTFTGFFGCGTAQPGQASNEFLAMTGPSSSADPSGSFSTTITWTAS